jgi:hypothetical protein
MSPEQAREMAVKTAGLRFRVERLSEWKSRVDAIEAALLAADRKAREECAEICGPLMKNPGLVGKDAALAAKCIYKEIRASIAGEGRNG